MVVSTPARFWLAWAIGILVSHGCVPTETPRFIQHTGFTGPVETAEVREIHVVWNDALLELNGKPHTRGFAARVYLFGSDRQEPVIAEGTFTFFAWREPEDVSRARVEPDRVWVFSPDEARQRLKKDSFGWGYSFWLPWGPADEPELRCNLRASFRADAGRVLVSDAATVVLPGPSKRLAEFRTLEQLKQTGEDAADAGPNGEIITREVPAVLRRPGRPSLKNDRLDRIGSTVGTPPGDRLD